MCSTTTNFKMFDREKNQMEWVSAGERVRVNRNFQGGKNHIIKKYMMRETQTQAKWLASNDKVT